MTSHIFLAMGMWPETEQANVHSMQVMNKAMAAHGMPPEACGHGNIWLVYAKLQQRKDVTREMDACLAEARRAIQTAKDLPVASAPEGFTGSWTQMALYAGIETGKWPQWPEFPAGRLTFARFFEDYGRLLASRHDAAGAQAALAAMKADRDVLVLNYPKEQPDDDTVLPWVDRAVAQGEAVVALAEGRSDQGLALLRKAAEAEAALPPPFGPPQLQKPSYELLGDELLALGRRAEAAEAYRHALAAAPNRRLSVAGLKAATANSALASEATPH
jgi:tetratricopeptide (TPR) repeat protein